MRDVVGLRGWALIGLLLCTTPMHVVARISQEQGAPAKAIIDEMQMRKFIKSHRLPGYPQAALQRKAQGVVVVEIWTTTTGAVESVKTLESPDPDISQEVETAVKSWSFGAIKAGVGAQAKPARVRSKLTFYFKIAANGRGIVTEPTGTLAASRKPGGTLGTVDEATARKLASEGAFVIDLTERGRAPLRNVAGARSIPLDELMSRTPELPSDKIILMLCPGGYDVPCRAMGSTVSELGHEVRILYK